MKCTKCGKEVKKTDAFCQYYGKELAKEAKVEEKKTTTKAVAKKEEVKVEPVIKEEPKKGNKGLAIAGMVLGILGVIFSLIIGPVAFLLPLLGLIFSLCGQKGGFKIAGIITSIISFVIEIVYLVLGLVLFSSILGFAGNMINNYSYASPYGEWTCTDYPSYSYSNNEETTLKLKYDGTYIYGPKDDLEDNHYSGTFTYTSETEKNEQYTGKKFFDIKAPVTEFKKDGVQGSTYGKNLNMEMQLINDYDEAIIMFYNTYNTYRCTK